MNEEAHKVVRYWAKKFSDQNQNSILDLQDYIQEGYLALLEAEDSYRPDAGLYFKWASSIVFRRLSHYASSNNSILKANKRSIMLSAKAHKLQTAGVNEESIIELLNISKDQYYEIKNLLTKDTLNNDDIYIFLPKNQFLNIEEHLTSEELSLLWFIKFHNLTQTADIIGYSYDKTRKLVNALSDKINSILLDE